MLGTRSSSQVSTNFGLTGHLEGWGAGGYWVTTKGPWSADVIGKVDFYEFSPTSPTVLPGGVPSSIYMTSYSGAGDLNYRINVSFASFIEPTVGMSYVHTDTDMNVLEMIYGDVVRVQGGARFGTTWMWNYVTVLATLKTLAYSNVAVSGVNVSSPGLAGLGPSFTTSTDQGKIRGEVGGFAQLPARRRLLGPRPRFSALRQRLLRWRRQARTEEGVLAMRIDHVRSSAEVNEIDLRGVS